MCMRGMSYLPIILVLLAFTTFVVSYIVALGENDVSAIFPYISDTGTKAPESCIFGQLLNITAAIALCTMYVRYKLVLSLIEDDEYFRYCRLNKAGLVFGTISALGLSIVGNFQETSVEPVHILGAAFVLGGGVIYSFIQTRISYKMHPQYNGIKICRWRLFFSMVSLITMITAFTAATVSRFQGQPADRLHWKPEEAGYTAHLISTITEWVTAIFFLMFFFTYIRDFQKTTLEVHSQVHVRHLDEEPFTNVYDRDEPNERTPLTT